MKKIVYIPAVICFLLILGGCVQTQKRVSPPTTSKGMSQTSETSSGTQQSPQYLDVTDSGGPTLDQVSQDGTTPALSYLNVRIFEYGRKLDRWKELDKQSLTANLSPQDTEQLVTCFKKLQDNLGRYTVLQEKVLQNTNSSETVKIDGPEILALQKADIEFLESPCGILLSSGDEKPAAWKKSSTGADLSQLESLVERYSANQEFEEVVQVWLQVPPDQVERVDLKTRLRYGNALMYLHQEEQAAKVYQQIVDQMSASGEQSTDLISLRKVLADLYTASGNYPAAESQYKKIAQDFEMLGNTDEWSKLQLSILERSVQGSPELTEYSSLLRNYLGFIPEKDGYKVVWQAEEFLVNYPYSAVTSNVDIIKVRAQEKADIWMNSFMGKIDQLVAEKKFDEAINLVETAPVDLMDEQKRNLLKSKKDDFVLAEAVDRETVKLANVQELQEKWNSGLLLVKAQRFDEAIIVFTELLNTEYSVKANEKIAEISLLAAREERRKAADLFIRYTKTTDLESQKKLLLESRQILQDILIKYPDVDIVDKVRGNIQRVEQEMNTIDPTLLNMSAGDVTSTTQVEIDAFDISTSTRQPETQLPIIVSPLPE